MPQQEQRTGTLYAIAAYVMWGIAPLYFAAVKSIPADEIVMHRVIWSFGLVLALVLLQKQWGQVRTLLRRPKIIGLLFLSASVIACNWLVFIWAVTNDHVIDASLGYFINPLLNVALGVMLLSERPGKLSLVAVALAAIGVLYQLVQFGSVPYVSLFLASSFGIYGLIRKQIKVQATTGLLIETALLLPFALLYWSLIDTASGDMSSNPLNINLLLVLSGVVTTLPLLAFSAAAVRIPFYLLGMLQYIGPSLMLVMALTIFGEQFNPEQTVTFGCIWLALILMSAEALTKARARRKAKRSSAA
ncbi:EamA family transporter RarD [Ferrimonas lipolytica]|uniref:EamA family transporter RarD n=1 Tax=Ferrimonas lipolytica TaxID=2724191 RepID=A0A6H1UHL9_9GAMM|nr:EamA family transporter RarD [Ferrimonas lipolytica]QIZ78100.1 EamA family transporter RarD [Ferrimonas lipolytica]